MNWPIALVTTVIIVGAIGIFAIRRDIKKTTKKERTFFFIWLGLPIVLIIFGINKGTAAFISLIVLTMFVILYGAEE